MVANSDYASDAVNFDTLLNEINKYFKRIIYPFLFIFCHAVLLFKVMLCFYIDLIRFFALFSANFVWNLMRTTTTEKQQTHFEFKCKKRTMGWESER